MYILVFCVCNYSFIIFTKLSCLLTKNETKNLGCHASRFVFGFFLLLLGPKNVCMLLILYGLLVLLFFFRIFIWRWLNWILAP